MGENTRICFHCGADCKDKPHCTQCGAKVSQTIEDVLSNPSQFSPKVLRRVKRFMKRLEKEQLYRKRITEKATAPILPAGKNLTHFRKYVYVNQSASCVIPFRFRQAPGNRKPLIIFHGGAGTLGCDNLKPLLEFFYSANGKAVVNSNCHILIPQQQHHMDDEQEALNTFTRHMAMLIKSLTTTYRIDESRIYIYGISFGAITTWQSLLNYPDLYAAAVPAMGMIFRYNQADLETIAHIPIWIAHADDDKAVLINSDDYCYQQLQNIGAEIKYTRWNKYGHRMMRRFYRQEPWIEWILSKKNNFVNAQGVLHDI